nr:MAG TPA: hypothetical protein [Caudoviricetes sp.]
MFFNFLPIHFIILSKLSNSMIFTSYLSLVCNW